MIRVENLNKSYQHNNAAINVLNSVSFNIASGEFVSIFGPNGCGKTTLLNLIAGMDKPSAGQIIFAYNKKIAFVFQNYRESLFPWLSVKDNIAYPLTLLKATKEKCHKQVQNICNEFNIKIDLETYPYTLSGGQQQLVAILRALITKPDIILMDEPFSSLDYQTTLFMMEKTQEIWLKTGTTIIFVSHDIDEAIFLSQRIILLSNKPTRIVKDIRNTLAHPRTSQLMGTPEFAELKDEVLTEFIKQVSIII